ncbi:MAG: hypothetical protein Q8S13_14265, partial [Dehalococcoidia bacterium]|nr:hypothetical protein [Dehalococcoidia bacterium]
PDNVVTGVLARMTRDRFVERGWRLAALYCDPAARARNVQTGIKDAAILREIIEADAGGGHHITEDSWGPRYSMAAYLTDVTLGIDRVRGAMNPADGPPMLYFLSSLVATEEDTTRGVIRDLGRYKYPEMKQHRRIAVREEPVHDESSDTMDGLRYLVVFHNAIGQEVFAGAVHL